MRKFVVIAYDIVSNKRRDKISDILSAYGRRVNYSVFECFLKERDLQELKDKIGKEVKKSEDIVLYYYLCRDCVKKIERVGRSSESRKVVKII